MKAKNVISNVTAPALKVWNGLKGLYFVGAALAEKHIRPADEGKDGFNLRDAGLFVAGGAALLLMGWAVANGSLIVGGFMLAKSTSALATAGIMVGMGTCYIVVATALQAVGAGALVTAGTKVAASTGLDDKIDAQMTKMFGNNWEKLREFVLKKIPKAPTAELKAHAEDKPPAAEATANSLKDLSTKPSFDVASAHKPALPDYMAPAANTNDPHGIKGGGEVKDAKDPSTTPPSAGRK